tara:strand:+ start:850 stop:1026 length:177 start_codon:yes stop_codon:yes gene_type:complete
MVVGLAGVGVAGSLGVLDLVGQRRGPFGPGEQAAGVQLHGHGEGLRLPGFGENRAVLV